MPGAGQLTTAADCAVQPAGLRFMDIGIKEGNIEKYKDYIGIMEKKMEATI